LRTNENKQPLYYTDIIRTQCCRRKTWTSNTVCDKSGQHL